MKRNLTLIIPLIFCAIYINAQQSPLVSSRLREVNNDTMKYVKEYIINKNAKYVGKTFEFLVQNLPTSVKHYINCSLDRPYGVIPVTQLYLYSFTEVWNRVKNKVNPIIITITWQTPYTFTELKNAGLSTSGLLWKQKGFDFLKHRIIKKIEMSNFDFSKPGIQLL